MYCLHVVRWACWRGEMEDLVNLDHEGPEDANRTDDSACVGQTLPNTINNNNLNTILIIIIIMTTKPNAKNLKGFPLSTHE